MVTDLVPSLTGYRLILASGSPRRRELLGMLGVEFDVEVPRDVEETYPDSLSPHQVPAYLSQLKSRAYAHSYGMSGKVVVTSDTIVICRGKILGKPTGPDDARRMLHELSGRSHTVVTGVTVAWAGGSVTESASTEVDFAHLTDFEIDAYVDRFRPFDKAGAYGIQEWIGCIGVKGIRGSFFNVMGLPLHLLYTMFRQVPPRH